MDSFEAELHAAALRSAKDFRVLRKLVRRNYCERPLGPWAKTGLGFGLDQHQKAMTAARARAEA